MQRRELKKSVSKYAKKIKFYKYGLIARYLKHLEKKKLELLKAVPKVKCPHCNSKDIDIELSDSEYSNDNWLVCNNCEEHFGDNYGYYDATEALRCLNWSDSIATKAHFEKDRIDFKSIKWQEFCEKEILDTINSKKYNMEDELCLKI